MEVLVIINNNRRLVTLAEHTSDHGRQTNSSCVFMDGPKHPENLASHILTRSSMGATLREDNQSTSASACPLRTLIILHTRLHQCRWGHGELKINAISYFCLCSTHCSPVNAILPNSRTLDGYPPSVKTGQQLYIATSICQIDLGS